MTRTGESCGPGTKTLTRGGPGSTELQPREWPGHPPRPMSCLHIYKDESTWKTFTPKMFVAGIWELASLTVGVGGNHSLAQNLPNRGLTACVQSQHRGNKKLYLYFFCTNYYQRYLVIDILSNKRRIASV